MMTKMSSSYFVTAMLLGLAKKKIRTVNRKILLPKSNDHNFIQLANKWYESSLKGRTKSGKCKICTFYLMFKNTVLEYSRPRFTAWKVPKYEVLLVQIQKNKDQKKNWFLDTFHAEVLANIKNVGLL